MTTLEMEIAIMNHFNIRQNIIVPNILWSFFNHEADIIILSKSKYATEIEIKISKADLKKDKEKNHCHESEMIKYLWFAVPKKLTGFALTEIPEKAGLIEVRENKGSVYINKIREPQLNSNHRKWTDRERTKLAELGCMRILGLKTKINNFKKAEFNLFNNA